MTIGVLLMAYGGPRSLEEVVPYYTDIRGGRPPTTQALAHLIERYRVIGGSSPLPEITRAQAEALRAMLNDAEPGRFKTYVGMKHWHPFIAQAVEQIVRDGTKTVVGLVMAPHYSRMSIGGYEDRLMKASEAAGGGFETLMIHSWYQEPSFVAFAARNLRESLREWEGARVFFTAHSLPARILDDGDPYRDQLLDSSHLVAEAADVPDWEFAFQSASETGEPWLGPNLLERLEAFAEEGGRRAVVAPIGFVADHLEVLYDIDVGCSERARNLGLELRRVPSPNDHPDFIAALADIVRRATLTAPLADAARPTYADDDPTLRSPR